MHMYSRLLTLQGGPVRPMEWAQKVTERVNAVMDVDVTLWSAAFGYPGGTVAWSTIVESRAQLADNFAKAGADQGFLDLAEEGAEFVTGPFTDTLRTIAHMTTEPTGEAPPMGAVAELVTAVAAGGKFAAATAWGAEIADQYKAVTGTDAVFLIDDYGPFGQVTWISLHETPAAADAAAAAAAGDEAYAKAIEKAGDLFLDGSGTRGSVIRIG
jgi:hypothetical protein